MSDARASILNALQAGQPWVPKPLAVLGESFSAAESREILAARFALEAQASDAEVVVAKDTDDALRILTELTRGKHVMAWELGSLGRQLAAGAIEGGGSWTTQVGSDRSRLELGITGCDRAIADTGSVVLVAGPGQLREASLVVRTHVVLVDPGDIVPDLPTALQWVAGLGTGAAHVNIVTGPSRTADIEMTLTRGVHGPKRLIAVVAPWRAMTKES